MMRRSKQRRPLQKGFGLSADCVEGTLSSDAAWDGIDTSLALTANNVVTSTPTSRINRPYVVDNVISCNGNNGFCEFLMQF